MPVMKGPRILARLSRHSYLVGFRGALGERRMLAIVDYLRRKRRLRPHRFFVGLDNLNEFIASARATQRYDVDVRGRAVRTSADVIDVNVIAMMLPGVTVKLEPFPSLGRGRAIVDVDGSAR